MGSLSAKEGGFGFGFNDMDFSDRVLHLEITPSLPSNMNSGSKKYLNWFSSLDDANNSECGDTDFEVKTLHVCSLMLAAKSPFFYKLFKNGMKESKQRDEVTLRINASEEAALLELLKFMYGIPLSATSAPELVDVLMAADKFEVPCCMQHCIQLLLELPMSTDSAVFYLDLPSSVLEGEAVQTLIDSAKKYLVDRYRNFTEFQEEAMDLPLSAVEIVIGSDGLQVDSEDVVFDFVLKWARLHYPELEERRAILANCLARYLCLPNMSNLKLKEVVDSSDFNPEQASGLLLCALSSKDQILPTTKYKFPRRVYKYRLIKVVQHELARPRCSVFLNLKKQECADLVPYERINSQTFCLGGRHLYLLALCKKEQRTFGLYMATTADSESCNLDFEFSVMKNSSTEYTSLGKANNKTVTTTGRGFADLFKTPWKDFVSDDNVYFIDGILHLRADIALIN